VVGREDLPLFFFTLFIPFNTPRSPIMHLDPSEQEKLAEELKVVEEGDLYKALHYVGDDPIKAEIEDVLKDLLPPDHFKTVLAVFNLSTGWKDD
jgi:hypothetical protein